MNTIKTLILDISCFFVIVFVLIFGWQAWKTPLVFFQNFYHFQNYPKTRQVAITRTRAQIVGLIAQKAVEANLDPVRVLKVAFKESSYNSNAYNPKSSAKGLFMFIDKTWITYCQGNILDPVANTDCFMRLYKIHPTWWATYEKKL